MQPHDLTFLPPLVQRAFEATGLQTVSGKQPPSSEAHTETVHSIISLLLSAGMQEWCIPDAETRCLYYMPQENGACAFVFNLRSDTLRIDIGAAHAPNADAPIEQHAMHLLYVLKDGAPSPAGQISSALREVAFPPINQQSQPLTRPAADADSTETALENPSGSFAASLQNILFAPMTQQPTRKRPVLNAPIRAVMKALRSQLLAAGMLEPEYQDLSNTSWRFYRPATALTAFGLILSGSETNIEIVYGFGSTAFTKMNASERALIELGLDKDGLNIRQYAHIRPGEDPRHVDAAIRRMYATYHALEKDALLDAAKQKRLAFIRRFAVNLKPLGFKKKGNIWTRSLAPDHLLQFHLSKRMYSDTYDMPVSILRTVNERERICIGSHINLPTIPIDWQQLTDDETDAILKQIVIPHLLDIIETPLIELGDRPDIWRHCPCSRTICTDCWIKKNLWEAKQK